MLQIFFAFLAGVLTIGAPCILPLLPILLGTSVGKTSKARPLYIVAGFVLVFAILGVFLSFLTTHVGLNANTLRTIAIVLLAIFGVLMVWPKPFELLTLYMGSFINRASEIGTRRQDNLGGFILGATLGIIWTPCAGPVLGTILTLIATQGNFAKSLVLLGAYAIGAGVPMLIVAYGSQVVSTRVRVIARYSKRLQQIFGVLIILLAIAMYYQLDIQIENKLAAFFPTQTLENHLVPNNSSSGLVDLGAAPDFAGIDKWFNSAPLTIAGLHGKVVLIDFWTFSCINCIRTLPIVTKWYDTYKDQGLVVVGVHTPEFPFEKDPNNVEAAIKQFKINYPVAMDNEYGTWNNYSNEYWPAEYLIDKDGKLVYTHFGEGEYDQTENTIRKLLGVDGDVPKNDGQDLSQVASPEMYFGTERLQYLTASQNPISSQFNFPQSLALNNFAMQGQWKFNSDNAKLLAANGKIKLHFRSGKVYMVAQSDKPQKISIIVDGKAQPDVTVSESELYTLFDSTDYVDHTIEITIPDAGFEAFTFTFG